MFEFMLNVLFVIIVFIIITNCFNNGDNYAYNESNELDNYPRYLRRPSKFMPVTYHKQDLEGKDLRDKVLRDKELVGKELLETSCSNCIIETAVIKMADGTTKLAKDIKIGDIVEGDSNFHYEIDFITTSSHSGQIFGSFTKNLPILVEHNDSITKKCYSKWYLAGSVKYLHARTVTNSKVYNFGTRKVQPNDYNTEPVNSTQFNLTQFNSTQFNSTKSKRGKYILVDGQKAMTLFSGVKQQDVYSKFWGSTSSIKLDNS